MLTSSTQINSDTPSVAGQTLLTQYLLPDRGGSVRRTPLCKRYGVLPEPPGLIYCVTGENPIQKEMVGTIVSSSRGNSIPPGSKSESRALPSIHSYVGDTDLNIICLDVLASTSARVRRGTSWPYAWAFGFTSERQAKFR